jgi:hypothetical protein
VGGRHASRAHVLVPEGLPARLHLAGVNHHPRRPGTILRPEWAVERVSVDDPLARHAAAGFELRVTPSIWPFWRRVTASTVEFSGSRLRNAAGHPERIG